MRRSIAPAVLVMCAAWCTPSLAQPSAPGAHSGLKPGTWEIVTQLQRSDVAGARTITSRLCHRPEDVAVAARVLPPQRGLGAQCLASDIRRGGEGIAWKLACSGKEGRLAGGGTMTPGPTRYAAQTTLEGRAGGKSVKVEQKTEGRWLGECT